MIDRLNDNEIVLIHQFERHPMFLRIEEITWEELIKVLIQRRFLSLAIVNTYEFVIDALIDNEIKRTVREILNEEFPRNTRGIPLPSHRELLFQDLLNLGATREEILTTPETPTTKMIREKSYELMASCLEVQAWQAVLVTFLRFWSEVLVSVEYSCLWKKISERLSSRTSSHGLRSEFYYYHMIHDSRKSDVGQESILGGLTHSQELAIHLKRLIVSKEILTDCMEMEKSACQLKFQFYDQFVDIHSRVHQSAFSD